MKLKLTTTDPLKIKTACLVAGIFSDQWDTPLSQELNRLSGGALREARRRGEFTGKEGESLLLQPFVDTPMRRLLLVGLGPRRDTGSEQLRNAAGTAITLFGEKPPADLACAFPFQELSRIRPEEGVAAVAEGLQLATYRFERYLTGKEHPKWSAPRVSTLLIDRRSNRTGMEAALAAAGIVADAVKLARDLVNEPGNVKSPEWLAGRAAAAATAGMKCTVLDRADLEREGCGALLGVAQGSVREPRLIVLEYRGGPADEAPVALVGKGVVFDAGGISLKPAEKMDEMKMDMAGGAAVIGTCQAVARLGLPLNLIGVIPAVENLPSGSAIRPGDILTSLSGQTIEILNTDAEGRLILADALTYVRRFQPRLVIDIATLTGACIIALGHHASAVLGNHPGLVQALRTAGEKSGERLWELPLWADYDRQIKSDVADVKNTGGRPAGTITAAAFLQRFAKGLKWAHLDIAGTAWVEQPRPCFPKGASGIGVRLLTAFLREQLPPRR